MKKQKRIEVAIVLMALLLVVVSPFYNTQVRVAWWNTAFSVGCEDAANADTTGTGEGVIFRFKLAEIWRNNTGK